VKWLITRGTLGTVDGECHSIADSRGGGDRNVRVWGAAEGSTVKVALSCEALTRVMLLAVRPAPLVDTVAPAAKLVPVIVTCNEVPGDALAGEMDDRVGPGPSPERAGCH
jgi:hypothetical protein